ncbi:unnamed protein product [Acanthoscelides obtectus]|uniref:Uncharacterized protein n=1 Tax=Acanthoscelides obtectus TaxID=200917 RepID=A0A9P0P968_ACAOB|nr:unnamed protein product [Acanthoscelides obtectus]CAK1640059.1 Insulin-like growth factor-binding protein complex acid labile subunit [Acanthoscelides obtectus]
MDIKIMSGLLCLLWLCLSLNQSTAALALPYNFNSTELMKCSYGERGSLTATCVNANASYFKMTPYRFDQLDETLVCSSCNLKTLESGTFDISGNQIKNLQLSYSKIELLKQKAFVGLIFLKNLNMSHNSITSVYPGTFTGVKKIESIDLSYNNITVLSDDGFLELINLKELNLAYNSIKTISSKAFNGLGNLVLLNLERNNITEVSDVLSKLINLQVLNLRDNQILKLQGSEFTNLLSLLLLDLSFNKLDTPVIEFYPNNSLKSLYITNNYIRSPSLGFLNGLHNLETLDLSYNTIVEIQKATLLGLYHLRFLNISYNRITTFQTGVFTGLPYLELLNMSHNAISYGEITGVFSLHSLFALDLSHNKIPRLDYEALISRLPRLSYLRLEGNPLPCDLEEEMNTYFEADNFKFVLHDPYNNTKSCVLEPTKHSEKVIKETVPELDENRSAGMSGGEVAAVILLCLAYLCLGLLFYVQYRTFRESRNQGPHRATSSVNLISAEDGRPGDEYLRE